MREALYTPDLPRNGNTPIDPSQTAQCEECGKRFCTTNGKTADEWLAKHLDEGHGHQPVQRRSLAQEFSPGPNGKLGPFQMAGRHLLAGIESGQYTPGTELTAKQISERADISENSAQRALAILAEHGRVELVPGTGTYTGTIRKAQMWRVNG